MSKGLILKSKKQVGLLKEQQKSGGGVPFFKPNWQKTKKGEDIIYVFICPPKNEDTALVTQVSIHEAFGANAKLTNPLVSVSNFDEKSDITEMGFRIKNSYKDKETKASKALVGYMIPKRKNIIFVIDPSAPEKGIQMWQAPYAVADYLIKYLEGDEDTGVEEGDMSFAHPTEGKLLKVKKTGAKLTTSYSVTFVEKEFDLGDINEENLVEMLEKLPNVLGGVFKKPSKDAIQTYKDFLDEQASSKGIALNWKNPKNSKLDSASDEDDNSDDTDVDDDELDTDDEKPSSKKTSKKPSKDDDEDEDDADVDLDDEEDDEDEY